MAKIEMRGMDAYIRQLEGLANGTEAVCKAAVYAGADVVADNVRSALRGLRVVSEADALAAYGRREPTYLSAEQRQALLDSLGVAPIRDKFGLWSTKVGFDGYNAIQTERWPSGQPNQLIARACESGSSAMLKQPFMRPTVNKSKARAEQAMAEAADKELKKLTGG